MSLTQGSLLLSHLIALAAFSALVMNDFFHWIGSVFGIGLIAASLLFALAGKRLDPAPRLWNILSILFCLFFFADVSFLSRDLLSGGMHFLTYLMVYRLLHLETSKDALQLYLISFLQLLAAAGDGSHFGYAISFFLSSFLMVGGLLVQHFRREQESLPPSLPRRSLNEAVPSRFLILSPLFTLTVLMITLLLFFLVPRIGIAFFQKRSPSLQRISGFSERVNLGALGPIKLDSSLVMRVVPITGEQGLPPPYLRGMSFDAYDGRAWQNTLTRKSSVSRGADERFLLSSPPRGQAGFKKTILLEPLDTAVLFTAGKPLSIEGPLSTLSRDESGTVYFPSNLSRRIEYEIAGLSEQLTDPERGTAEIAYPPPIGDRYLAAQVSTGGTPPNPEIAALAREITAPYSTVHEKAAAIERYLKTNYTYTLDVPPSSRPPIEAFLFDHKKGYCEYYASAMILLLRSVGIASRLVTGFLPGEWNAVGQYYLVRQSDAHAWVEVYFPGERWLSFDPTPSVQQKRNAILKMTAAYVDWMQLKWDRYIVRYSLRDQFDFVQRTGERLATFPERFSERVASWKKFVRSLPGKGAPALGILLLLLAAGSIFRARRGTFQRRKGGAEGEIAAHYRQMLRMLANRGVRKAGHQTPFEFIETLRTAEAAFVQEAEGMTEIYCRVRFGGRRSRPDEAVEMKNLLTRLRALL